MNLKYLSQLLGMTDESWKRHSNPLSVWTRLIFTIPAILWSLWLLKQGSPFGYLSLFLTLLWIWINPRIFNEPKNTNSWAAKVTIGERYWISTSSSIPKQNRYVINLLITLSGLSFCIALYSIYNNNHSLIFVGGLLSIIFKVWFCDQMVCLYETKYTKNSD